MTPPQRLSSLETTFLALDSREVPFVPAVVIQLERPLALAPLRSRIDALVTELPRYRQRISRFPLLPGPTWIDGDFAIERHVGTMTVAATSPRHSPR